MQNPKRNKIAGETDRLRGQIAGIEAKLAANEVRLEKDFPDYES